MNILRMEFNEIALDWSTLPLSGKVETESQLHKKRLNRRAISSELGAKINYATIFFGRVPPESMILGSRDLDGVLAQLGSMSHNPWDMRKAFWVDVSTDLEQLKQTPPIKELAKFLEQVQNEAVLSGT
jgi:hypothetical protein